MNQMLLKLLEQLCGACEGKVMNLTYLVTGSAGFIGSALTLRLLERGDSVVGIDNHNSYYDPALKEARLARYVKHVINLAAQAGVRYSIDNPMEYIESNIVGFANILEGCRNHGVEHLVYASSSSVYGANTAIPYSIQQNVDHPISLYAASKKTNELIAHTYKSLTTASIVETLLI